MKRLVRVEHSSLLDRCVGDDEKEFYNVGAGLSVMSFVFTWVVQNTKRALGHRKKEEESIPSQKNQQKMNKKCSHTYSFIRQNPGTVFSTLYFLCNLIMGPISFFVTY
jgi:hypothetical protein